MTARKVYRETMDTTVEILQCGREIVRSVHTLSEAGGREATKIGFQSELGHEGVFISDIRQAIKDKKITPARIPYYERKYDFKYSSK
tara:strand:+ start:222 stop:482 length:261 start_codon:yes stop_codon:yes gene_type:complete